MDPIDDLIANHPDLDVDALTSAYLAMEDEEGRPRAYSDDERAAHELVLAVLQHRGLEDWDGTSGELSDRSRVDLLAKLGLVEISGEGEAERVVVMPLGVFENLLADFLLLSNTQARATGDGNAQELWLRRVQSRLAEDAARRAWLASHPDDDGPR